MIYAIIAAGGIGSRMGNVQLPKQYLLLNDKPIIAHTVSKFFQNEKFKKIIIACPESWVDYTQDIMNKHFDNSDKIKVICGGETRNDTLMNAIDFIDETDKLTDDTIIVTHDAVRPFVTNEIIENNITAAITHGATGTYVPTTDTIVYSDNGDFIGDTPDRSKLFNAQTPQCFKAKLLKEIYENLSEKEKLILTDACKILTLNNQEVFMVNGAAHNIKITYPYDLKVAKVLIEEGY